ncbi:MAG: SDR family NAD(P)-dependent oxidoreductase [Verrucomicrobiaceae bacterium]|nr:SDR family NAD(P)-dependent oxidoreductase [Verrucomicrobiaceae bacterium]
MGSFDGKKVLVTGAGGFIGSHLAEHLVREGATVRAMVHYNALGKRGWLDHSELAGDMEILAGDITDRDSVRAGVKDRDIIFHLGALIAIPYSYQAPRSYVRANIEGTLNVLQAALDIGAQRVLHTSTSEVYGTAQFVPITEEHPLQGQSPYSASKIGADKMAEAFAASFELEVVTVRPFNTFGPRQSMRAVIPTIITQCLRGQNVHLGAVHPTRDLNFVQNTVEGFCAAALSPNAAGQAINFGSGREISVGDLAILIGKMMGKEIEIVCEEQRLRPTKSEVERLLACNKKAKELCNWEPRTTLEQGLEKTIAFIEANVAHYQAKGYVV